MQLHDNGNNNVIRFGEGDAPLVRENSVLRLMVQTIRLFFLLG